MASSASASIVASECAQARRYRPVRNSRDSAGVTHMSDIGSASSHGSWSWGQGRPNVSPKIGQLGASLMLDQPEQVGAGRYQRTADVVLGEPVMLPQQRLAAFLKVTAKIGFRIRPGHADICHAAPSSAADPTAALLVLSPRRSGLAARDRCESRADLLGFRGA